MQGLTTSFCLFQRFLKYLKKDFLFLNLREHPSPEVSFNITFRVILFFEHVAEYWTHFHYIWDLFEYLFTYLHLKLVYK